MDYFWMLLIGGLVAIAFAVKVLVSRDESDSSLKDISPSLPADHPMNDHPGSEPIVKNEKGRELTDESAGDPIFDRNKFYLNQKHFSISEKYYLYDDTKKALLFVERPAHFWRNFMALMGAIFVGIVCFIFMMATIVGDSTTGEVNYLLVVMSIVIGIILPVITFAFLCKIRQINFYRDDSKAEQLFEVRQDFKFRPLHMSYTVLDKQGEVIARLRKDYIYNILRKKWICKKPDGTIWCTILEDSIIQSLLRRMLGPLLGLLRTNFIILNGTSQSVIGEFNRKLTLTDQYILDMSNDPEHILDRRVAIAIGVLLDTGEKR